MRRVISLATVRRVIGLAIVAAGLWITFLPVSTSVTNFDTQQSVSVVCGSVWQAMLSSENNLGHECDLAALPRVWIAGGVAAIGMAVAFWGASRRLLLGMVGLVVLLTLLIALGGWAQSKQGLYGGMARPTGRLPGGLALARSAVGGRSSAVPPQPSISPLVEVVTGS
jgi:hypothetical protein